MKLVEMRHTVAFVVEAVRDGLLLWVCRGGGVDVKTSFRLSENVCCWRGRIGVANAFVGLCAHAVTST